MNSITFGHVFLVGVLIIQVVIVIIIALYKRKNVTAQLANHLHHTEERYRDLFENANDAIFILDRKQNYIDVNLKAVELFGYTREEFLQLNVWDVIPRTQTKSSDKEFIKLRETGEYEKFEGKQKTKDGRWLDIEVNSSTIMKNCKFIGSRDIVRDITDRKKQEAEREALIDELKSALEEIKTLRGMLPICVNCKKIRDEKGYWNRIESYITHHSEAEFTHSCCPDCLRKLHPEIADEVLAELNSKS